MYNEYIDKEELEEIKSNIITNNLDYKSYLKYYKLSIVLNDRNFCEILTKTIPKDLTETTEEKFYELTADLKLRLLYRNRPY